MDGLHPQELIARATTGGLDSCLERLNLIGGAITRDINSDLRSDGADPQEALSSVSFAAKEGSAKTSPTIVVRITRIDGASTTAEINTND
jgi:hypothetical protein